MTQQELKEAIKNAWPIECMKAHGAEDRTVEEVGTIPSAYGRYLKVFRDNIGEYWYKTMIGTKDGVVSEYEAIFGRPEKKRA